jgi:hypothetical protein
MSPLMNDMCGIEVVRGQEITASHLLSPDSPPQGSRSPSTKGATRTQPGAMPHESQPSTTRGPKVRFHGRTVEAGLQPSRICESVTQGVALGWLKYGALPLTKTSIAALNAASTRPKGAAHASPRQRPGNQSPTEFEALKGRPNRCPDRLPASTHTSCSAPKAQPMDRAPQAQKARPQAGRRRSRESNPSTTRGPKVRPNVRTVGAGFQPSWICETRPQGVALGWRKDGALPLMKTPIAALNAESAEVLGTSKELL